MGMGVGYKSTEREPESDNIEGIKVSRCYFKTRPLILKIKGRAVYVCRPTSVL